VSGSGIATGTLLTFSTFTVLALSYRRGLVLQITDVVFLVLLACIAFSFNVNQHTTSTKEVELLILSLTAYPACRFISPTKFTKCRYAFFNATAALVCLGAFATALAIYNQWDDGRTKPAVLGFEAAPIYFLGSLGVLAIAVGCRKLSTRQTISFSIALFFPVAVFAASMVRFTFIAMIVALCIAALFSDKTQRVKILMVIIVVLAGISVGLAARLQTSELLLSYAADAASSTEVTSADAYHKSILDFAENRIAAQALPNVADFSDRPPNSQTSANDSKIKSLAPGPQKPTNESNLGDRPPSCHMNVNLRNSIDIRKAVWEDAIFYLPRAGPLGFGLDNFMQLSCVEGTEVHSSVLQTAVEFGWIAGLSFVILIGSAGYSLLQLARSDDDARFVLSGLAYVVVLSMGYGRISQDALIFAFLGLASSFAGSIERDVGVRTKDQVGPSTSGIRQQVARA
jgi:O-antigen ligase